MTAELDRGVVVRVRLDPTEGSELRKTRPAIVISNSTACRFDSVVQIVPVTRLPDRDLRPHESELSSAGTGLARASRAVANQVRTVSKRRITRVLGRISKDEETALDQALRIQLTL